MDGLRRREVLALLGAPVLASLLAACGDDATEPAEIGATRSGLARTSAAGADTASAAAVMDGLGMALYRRLAAGDPTGNLVISPASIATALTMTLAGARGSTLAEMVATMHIDDPTAIHHSMNALTAQLAALSRGGVELSIANSLWAQSGLHFAAPFLDVLASEYGAGLELVDYRADAEAARLAIDQWVDEQTHGRIPELLAPGTLSTGTRLTLVNAVYLKAAWQTPFMADATTDGSFTTAAGDTVTVPMMHGTMQLDYATGDGWRAVELPYADSSLAMLVFLPEDGFLEQFEESFLLTDATPYLAPERVALQLPRFDIGSQLSLADQLGALGMPTAFDPRTADFSGMTADERLSIGAVVHQADITCDEAGTEAAAATAVAIATSAVQPEPVELVIDRPFVFALRDRESGAILFLGRVGDPRG